MGRGSYTASDWAKLKASRGLSDSGSANDTFKNSKYLDKYNARFVAMRESFDSEDSPESTPVIIGFDVTGSMGYLAQEIATNALNETIMQILATKPVTDPHMLCAAFTDPGNPLQVTQFEADIRVVEQLLDFKLGGSNLYAYDTILWYFAANHTKTDCFEKRGRKGILIGIGDEVYGSEYNKLDPAQIWKLFGDAVTDELTFSKLLAQASEKYEVVHIVTGDSDRFEPGNCYESCSGWKKALPGRVAAIRDTDIGCLAEVIVAIMRMLGGADRATVLMDVPEEKRSIVEDAIRDFGPEFEKPKGEKFEDRLKRSLESHK